MSRRSRVKGVAFEREVARWLTSIDAQRSTIRTKLFGEPRRGSQFRRGHDAPDVEGFFWWVECKVGKRPSLVRAIQQAIKAAASDKHSRPPLVIARVHGADPSHSGRPLDLVVMLAEDWGDLVSSHHAPIFIKSSNRRSIRTGENTCEND